MKAGGQVISQGDCFGLKTASLAPFLAQKGHLVKVTGSSFFIFFAKEKFRFVLVKFLLAKKNNQIILQPFLASACYFDIEHHNALHPWLKERCNVRNRRVISTP